MKIHEIISDKLPHPTILKTSTCSASKIYPNVTLLGGIKSGNFTSLGKTKNMQECIGKTCELGRGDLAFMLGSYCYSVSCSSGRVCQTIPAQPSKFYPRIAFLKWAPKINETGKMKGVAVIYFYPVALDQIFKFAIKIIDVGNIRGTAITFTSEWAAMRRSVSHAV